MPNDDKMTIEQFAKKLIKDIKQMSPDDRAHLRGKLRNAFGLKPEPSSKPN